MSASQTGRRAPGRPRAFDETAVLDAAIDVFWRCGYARASMSSISAATGLAPSSLYNVYGSKLDLFACALDRYLDLVFERLLGPLAHGSAGLADIDAFFAQLLGRSGEAQGPPGCLAANTIGELRDAPPVVTERTERYREMLRRSLRAALTRAATNREIPADAVASRADALLAIVIASSLLSAAGAPTREVRALLCAARVLATAR